MTPTIRTTVTTVIGLGLALLATGCASSQPKTTVTIDGDNFRINGQLTYSDIPACPPTMPKMPA